MLPDESAGPNWPIVFSCLSHVLMSIFPDGAAAARPFILTSVFLSKPSSRLCKLGRGVISHAPFVRVAGAR